MTALTYRAMWPIIDQERTASALIAEASAALDLMAATDGARIAGTPRWTVAGDRLICEAPAVPIVDEPAPDPAEVRERRDRDIIRLRGLRWSSGQIGAVLDVPPSTVRTVLNRHNIRTAHAPGGALRSQESETAT